MNATVSQLIDALGDFRTRSEARRQLSKLGESANPELIQLLLNPEAPPNARWSAITLLAKNKSKEAIRPLLDVMRSDDNLRGDTCRALQKITELDIGEDLEAWEDALSEHVTETAPVEEPPDIPHPPLLDLVLHAMPDLHQNISWEEDSYVLIRVPLPQGRKQQMIVMEEETEDPQAPSAISIYTECGPEPPHVEQVVYRRNVTLPYGKFTVEHDDEGNGSIAMRHTVPANQINAEKLHDIIMVMSREADNLEFEITHSDII